MEVSRIPERNAAILFVGRDELQKSNLVERLMHRKEIKELCSDVIRSKYVKSLRSFYDGILFAMSGDRILGFLAMRVKPFGEFNKNSTNMTKAPRSITFDSQVNVENVLYVYVVCSNMKMGSALLRVVEDPPQRLLTALGRTYEAVRLDAVRSAYPFYIRRKYIRTKDLRTFLPFKGEVLNEDEDILYTFMRLVPSKLNDALVDRIVMGIVTRDMKGLISRMSVAQKKL